MVAHAGIALYRRRVEARKDGPPGGCMRRHCWTLACALLALAAAPALAQDQIESYRPDFFESARPATAMEMINRLPGFSFDGGDGSRGFSGNAGNVLIN